MDKRAIGILGCIVVAGCVVFAAIQLIRPKIGNPPVTADFQAPADVKDILRTSCYNCHSNETRLYWFDEPAPAYWIVADDVSEGRKHLNFSEIGRLPSAQQEAILFEAVSQIELGAMPLRSYKLAHPESAITPEKLAILRNYLRTTIRNASGEAADPTVATEQYRKWIEANGSTPAVKPAPDGIAFIPEYKNWKAISSTDRTDNGTLRQILGNEIAVKAIAENHINPWPDGTEFAKVAWFQQPDGRGGIQSGAFFQVEFMIRDSKKYAETLGWGWARWRGANLEPYGKDVKFTEECVGCHKPMRDADYVFTEPIGGQE